MVCSVIGFALPLLLLFSFFAFNSFSTQKKTKKTIFKSLYQTTFSYIAY